MDVLQQQYNNNNSKNTKSSAQKTILRLIVISVILFIILLVALLYSKSKPVSKEFSLNIDDKTIAITSTLLVEDTNGNKYISLQELAPLIGYKYYNGEYLKYAEERTKCYLEGTTKVIGFEQNSKQIYKTDITSEKDYKYYNLSNNIIVSNGVLYISINDIQLALDVYENYSKDANEINIYTLETLVNQYKEAINKKELDYAVESSEGNNITVLDEMLIISSNLKYGVINTNGEVLIGTKYNSIQYEEYTKDFIVSNANNRYGIITKDGNIKIDFNYDSIEIINYEPTLYKVKRNNLFGIMDKTGNLVLDIKYSSFGFPANLSNNTETTLVIKDLNDGTTGIVVAQNGKYGLVSITSGNEIIPCNLSKIYSRTNRETNKKEYYVEIDSNEYELENYISSMSAITVQM